MQKVVSEYDKQLMFPESAQNLICASDEIVFNVPVKKSTEKKGLNIFGTVVSAIVLIGAIAALATTILKVGTLAILPTALSGFGFPLAIAGAAVVGVLAGIAFVYNTYQWVKKSRQKYSLLQIDKDESLIKETQVVDKKVTPKRKRKYKKEEKPDLVDNTNKPLLKDEAK